MDRNIDVQLFKVADEKLSVQNDKDSTLCDAQQVKQSDRRQFWKGINTALSNLQRAHALQPVYQDQPQFNRLLGGMFENGNGGGSMFGGEFLGLGSNQTQTDGFQMEHSSSGQPNSQNNADLDATDTNCSKRRRLRTPLQQEKNKLAQQRYRERCKSKHKEMEQTICRFNTRINELENENKRLRDNDANLRHELHSLEMENKKLKQTTPLVQNSENTITKNVPALQLPQTATTQIQDNSAMQIQQQQSSQDESMQEEQELSQLLRLSHHMHSQIQFLVENSHNQKLSKANLESQKRHIDLQNNDLVRQIENLIRYSKEYGYEDQIQALLQQGGDDAVAAIVELLNQLQPVFKDQDKKDSKEKEQEEQVPLLPISQEQSVETDNAHMDDQLNMLLFYLFQNLTANKGQMSSEAFSEYCESLVDIETIEFMQCDAENMQIEWKHKRLQSAIRIILQLCTGGDGNQVSQLVCFIMDALCVQDCEIKCQVYKLVRQEITQFYEKIKYRKATVEDLQHVARCIFKAIHRE